MVRVSVAINNYNYKRFIGEAIDSVLAQTHPAIEIIVVDDGSTDGSADYVAENYGGRVRLIRSENMGQLSAFRLGIQSANGDFIAFLDSDDRWKPHHLAEAAKRLEADPSADFIIGARRVFGEHLSAQPVSELSDHSFGWTTLAGMTGEDIGAETSCLIARKTCLSFLDALPPELLSEWRLCADYVVVFGASIGGARKIRIGSPTVDYRAHGQNGHLGRIGTAEQKKVVVERREKMIRWLYDHYFPGMNAVEIIRRELSRNTIVKWRNKRRLFKAAWRSPAPLLDKTGAALAILAKR